MKIFSKKITAGDGTPIFALYVDTEKTGDQLKDCVYIANDFTGLENCNDAEKLLNFLTPMLAELLYTIYGSRIDKQPITDWHATGFDRSKPNGVNI